MMASIYTGDDLPGQVIQNICQLILSHGVGKDISKQTIIIWTGTKVSAKENKGLAPRGLCPFLYVDLKVHWLDKPVVLGSPGIPQRHEVVVSHESWD